MKINSTKIIAIAIVAGSYSLSQAQPGEGEFGANRRVSTLSGYGGVVGTFSEPRFNNPYNQAQQNHIDRPELYLGVRAYFGRGHPDNLEVDSGLTWIPATNPTGRRNANANMWTAFSRATGFNSENDGQYVSPWFGGSPWVVSRGALGSARVAASIRDSTAEGTFLYMEVIHNRVSMPYSRNIGDPTSDAQGLSFASQMVSKRVTAITQLDGTFYDDAFLLNAQFTNGKVYPIQYDTVNNKFELGSLIDWDNVGGGENGVANRTHFSPWGRYGQPITSGPNTVTVVDNTLPWVIQLDTRHARPLQGNGTGEPTNVATLFGNETVSTRLYNPRPIRATPVGPRRVDNRP